VRHLDDKGHRGINVLEWDLLVDRDVELDRQLKKTQKKIKEIEKKISKPNKDAEEKDADIEVADSNEPETTANSDETDEKEQAGEKDRERRLKLKLDLRNARIELDKIKEVIDEPKTYADLPQETREKMIRKIYISAGKYTVEIKAGENTHSTTLQVK
jgi:chromosome segregation ATPase